jgi:hypothetical protein
LTRGDNPEVRQAKALLAAQKVLDAAELSSRQAEARRGPSRIQRSFESWRQALILLAIHQGLRIAVSRRRS